MCGFVAIVNDRGAPDMTVLARMAASLEHRGPDGEGTYNEQGVGFHHKRLAVIDVAGGMQPMCAQGVAVVCNGEIYNYIELRNELKELGHRFETESDTEVLLHAYLQWGNQAVARLNGMFAFVIHDSRTNTIVAARDAFGIKPLYRARVKGATIYASEIKAILVHPGFVREKSCYPRTSSSLTEKPKKSCLPAIGTLITRAIAALISMALYVRPVSYYTRALHVRCAQMCRWGLTLVAGWTPVTLPRPPLRTPIRALTLLMVPFMKVRSLTNRSMPKPLPSILAHACIRFTRLTTTLSITFSR